MLPVVFLVATLHMTVESPQKIANNDSTGFFTVPSSLTAGRCSDSPPVKGSPAGTEHVLLVVLGTPPEPTRRVRLELGASAQPLRLLELAIESSSLVVTNIHTYAADFRDGVAKSGAHSVDRTNITVGKPERILNGPLAEHELRSAEELARWVVARCFSAPAL
jgi:hypothetical protein